MEKPSRRLHRYLALFGLLLFHSFLVRADSTPYFVIFSPGIDLNEQANALEDQGVRVKNKIPPSIMEADFPDSISGSHLSSIQIRYKSVVPVETLARFGPLAVAAGVQWNRRVLGDSKSLGAKSFGSVKALVAQQSLPAPKELTATLNPRSLRCSWKPAAGALYYQVQMAADEVFKQILSETRTNHLQIDFPLPDGLPKQSYVRVRALDKSAENDNGIEGGWSTSIPANLNGITPTESLPKPILTSPVDKLTSQGFSIVLEWQGNGSDSARIELSKSSAFDPVFIDEIVSGQEFAVPSSAMHTGDTYFWRVKTWGNQTSTWSAPRQFTIGEPASVETDMFVNPEAPR